MAKTKAKGKGKAKAGAKRRGGPRCPDPFDNQCGGYAVAKVKGMACIMCLRAACFAVGPPDGKGINKWFQLEEGGPRFYTNRSKVPPQVIRHVFSEDEAEAILGKGGTMAAAKKALAGCNARRAGKADAPAPKTEQLPFDVQYTDDGLRPLCWHDGCTNKAFHRIAGLSCTECPCKKYGKQPCEFTGIVPLVDEVEGEVVRVGMLVPHSRGWMVPLDDVPFLFNPKLHLPKNRRHAESRVRILVQKKETTTACKKALSEALAKRTATQERATMEFKEAQLPAALKLKDAVTPKEGELATDLCNICFGARKGDGMMNNEQFGHIIHKGRNLWPLIREEGGTGRAITLDDLRKGILKDTWTCELVGIGTDQQGRDVEKYLHQKLEDVAGRLWLFSGMGASIGNRAVECCVALMHYKGWGADVREAKVGGLAFSLAMPQQAKERFCKAYGLNVEEHFVRPNYKSSRPLYKDLFEALLAKRERELEKEEEEEWKALSALDAALEASNADAKPPAVPTLSPKASDAVALEASDAVALEASDADAKPPAVPTPSPKASDADADGNAKPAGKPRLPPGVFYVESDQRAAAATAKKPKIDANAKPRGPAPPAANAKPPGKPLTSPKASDAVESEQSAAVAAVAKELKIDTGAKPTANPPTKRPAPPAAAAATAKKPKQPAIHDFFSKTK